MNTKVTFYKGVFDAKMKKACAAASLAVGHQIRTDTYNLVPKRDNILRDSARVEASEDGSAKIVWNTVYAKRQYTHPAMHYTTPGTTDHWVEAAQKNRGALWSIVAQKTFAKELN